MNNYAVAVVGAGPAGIMASIRSRAHKKSVVLLERNSAIGKKLLVTGKGRCNVTNAAPIEIFIEKFGKRGAFLRTAFTRFSNADLIALLETNGVTIKVERQGRVFPESDLSSSVVIALKKCLENSGVELRTDIRIVKIRKDGALFHCTSEPGQVITAQKIILAAGGASYKETGSAGDGFDIARSFGHTITHLVPALVPLTTCDGWVRSVQGLALKNIRLNFLCGKKKIVSEIGEMIFTHFGVSGPLILDLSGTIATYLRDLKKIPLAIDLKPALTPEQIERNVLRATKEHGTTAMKNILRAHLPSALIPEFLTLANIPHDKQANQLTQSERRTLIALFKALPLTVNGTLPLEEAMVTGGGVDQREINPRTMESRMVPGLYFAGEIIDGFAQSGGYNLQQAFSTGYLAGDEAALSCVD